MWRRPLLTTADDQPALVRGDGEGHLPARRTPVALASSPTPATRGHARTPGRTWGPTLQDREAGELAARWAGTVWGGGVDWQLPSSHLPEGSVGGH